MAVLLALAAFLIVPAKPASAATVTYWTRVAALHWAESQAGKPYIYGGTGPYGYDCSGLVYEAYLREGVAIPRTTYGMLGSWHLYRVYRPAGGDLAFYGSGHVELVARAGYTFGALHTGTVLGYHRITSWWRPTMYFRIR